uniref:Protein lin-54 homolog isoform X2 n=1 Tax=Hirondellea gigas TaxID=1518452 RepID=A0A6A7FPF8_9CRUS
MPQNNHDPGVGGGSMVDSSSSAVASSSSGVLLDAGTFAGELSQHDLEQLVGLNLHTSAGGSILHSQHQLITTDGSGLLSPECVEEVVEVHDGGIGSRSHIQHQSNTTITHHQHIGGVASMLQDMDGVEHFAAVAAARSSLQSTSTSPPSFSINSSLDFSNHTTTSAVFTTTSPTSQGFCTNNYLQESMDEVDSGIGDIASYTSVTSGGGGNTNITVPHTTAFQLLPAQVIQDNPVLLDTSTGDANTTGIMDTSSPVMLDASGGGIMDSSAGGVIIDSSAVGGVIDISGADGSTLLDDSCSTTATVIAADDHDTSNSGGGGGISDMDDVVMKNVTFSGQQILRTSMGQFIIKQSPVRNNAKRVVQVQHPGEFKTTLSLQSLQKQLAAQGLGKLVLTSSASNHSNFTSSSMLNTNSQHHNQQQIRLIPTSSNNNNTRTVVLSHNNSATARTITIPNNNPNNNNNIAIVSNNNSGGGLGVNSTGSTNFTILGSGNIINTNSNNNNRLINTSSFTIRGNGSNTNTSQNANSSSSSNTINRTTVHRSVVLNINNNSYHAGDVLEPGGRGGGGVIINNNNNNSPGSLSAKLTVQQAQKLGLLSSPGKVAASPTKIVMRQVLGGNNSVANRLVFTQVSTHNNNHHQQQHQQTILLKSPTKIAPAPQHQIVNSSNVRVLPSTNTLQQKIIIKSANQLHKGVVRSQLFDQLPSAVSAAPAAADAAAGGAQSVIKISAANPAVQAAAAAANTNLITKNNMVRVVSTGPASGGSTSVIAGNNGTTNKLIAPSSSQQIKLKPISIAPSNQNNKQQQQQQCVIIPVPGNNNNLSSSGGSKNNSVVMIPIQYLSQFQSNFNVTNNNSNNSQQQIVTLTTASSNNNNAGSSVGGTTTLLSLPSDPQQQQHQGLNSSGSTVGQIVPNSSLTVKPTPPPPPPPPKTIIDANGIKARKPCNCNKSQCLKLYCDCFANGEFCNNCNCTNCYNNLSHEEERQKAIKSCLDRNPNAFKPKIGKGGTSTERRHNKGCNCKRSGCLKNYCECYEAKIPCSSMCKCYGCKNVDNATLIERRKQQHLPPDPSTIITNNAGHNNNSNASSSNSMGGGLLFNSGLSFGSESGGSISFGGGGGLSRTSSGVSGTGSMIKGMGSTPSKLSMSKLSHGSNLSSSSTSSSSNGGINGGGGVSYKISQEIVSATCGCIIATASRSQKQQLDRRQTEIAVIKEFSNCLQHIIHGCMQTHSKVKGIGSS